MGVYCKGGQKNDFSGACFDKNRYCRSSVDTDSLNIHDKGVLFQKTI